jgi:FdhD protein
MAGANRSIKYIQVESGRWEHSNTIVIVETPVTLTINGEAWLTFMCTPIDLDAMAVGFLFNEGLIQSISEVVSVRVCPSGDNIDVWLNHTLEKPVQWRRTSGCTGGITSIVAENIDSQEKVTIIQDDSTLTSNQVSELISQLFDTQDLYRKSGGVHTSALSDGSHLYVVTEDIGRHNTLDKIAGRCLLDRLSPPRRILLTTGRISSDMLQKADRLGASIVISRTSPSSLSIQMAEKWGITLIGYARRNNFRIYTHPERIILAP